MVEGPNIKNQKFHNRDSKIRTKMTKKIFGQIFEKVMYDPGCGVEVEVCELFCWSRSRSRTLKFFGVEVDVEVELKKFFELELKLTFNELIIQRKFNHMR